MASFVSKFTRCKIRPLMDLVGKFRQLAAHIFLEHMKRQRDQLLAILKDAGKNV